MTTALARTGPNLVLAERGLMERVIDRRTPADHRP
jgi:hypothetical protein